MNKVEKLMFFLSFFFPRLLLEKVENKAKFNVIVIHRFKAYNKLSKKIFLCDKKRDENRFPSYSKYVL